jgi:hypothetical protein
MWGFLWKGRRKNRRRAFQPALEGRLEMRALMSRLPSAFFLANTAPQLALQHNEPKFLSAHAPHIQNKRYPRGEGVNFATAHGGQSVQVATPDGHFLVQLTQFIPPAGEGQAATTTSTNSPGTQNPIQGQTPGSGAVQPIGTVRAYAMPGGRVGIIVDGSTTQTELDISPLPFPQRKGFAHSFAYGQTTQSHILNIGQLTVNSGQISAILGYHTADLSGPLTATASTPVDRIAFNALLPGASITTGGDLNTLDILNGVTLNGGPGIHIGRDLNLLNVGTDIDLNGGASIFVGRFLGDTPQPPKGTATGSNFLAQNQALIGAGTTAGTLVPSLSGNIQGNINIGAGSTFTVVSGISNSSINTDATTGATSATPSVFLVDGQVATTTPTLQQTLQIPNLVASTTFVTPTTPPQAANFVAKLGFIPAP